MLTEAQRAKIKTAYRTGTLKVRSVSPGGAVAWKRIENVLRNEVPWEHIVSVTTAGGTMVLTGGHPVYVGVALGQSVKAETLQPGTPVLTAVGDAVVYLPVQSVKTLPARQFMYDLTVEDWHRFVITHGGTVVGNSPDRNYHFRPPEAEGNIGQYNRVFGQIWEDAELNEYLERGLDWWNMMPPNTAQNILSIDQLVTEKPEWRTAVLWDAITHACFALACNWVADEFDYSIGGVSLTIEKSSKYESLKQNAESQFDKAAEAKARTVKFIRGIQQPKYGLGVRSAFGPAVGRGVLSPRNFLVLPLILTLYTLLHPLASALG
jgi:hypothetical protein